MKLNRKGSQSKDPVLRDPAIEEATGILRQEIDLTNADVISELAARTDRQTDGLTDKRTQCAQPKQAKASKTQP